MRAHQLQHLPPQKQRALKKASEVLHSHIRNKRLSDVIRELARTAINLLPDFDRQSNTVLDPYLYAEQWLEILRPYQRKLQEVAIKKRSGRLYSIADIPAKDVLLDENTLETLITNAPTQGAQWEQVTACIIALPQAKG